MSNISRRQALTGAAGAGIAAALPAVAAQAEATRRADDKFNALLIEHWAARRELINASTRAEEALRHTPVVGSSGGYYEWNLDGMSQISDYEADIRNCDRKMAYRALAAAQEQLADVERKLAAWRQS